MVDRQHHLESTMTDECGEAQSEDGYSPSWLVFHLTGDGGGGLLAVGGVF